MAHIVPGRRRPRSGSSSTRASTTRSVKVHEGTATMDWMVRARRGVDHLRCTTCFWKDYRINIIDTPGHVDFTAEVERSLRIMAAPCFVFDAGRGRRPQSRRLAAGRQVPRAAPRLRQQDGPGRGRLRRCVDDALAPQRFAAVIQLPLGAEDGFRGVIDLVAMKGVVLRTRPWAPTSRNRRHPGRRAGSCPRGPRADGGGDRRDRRPAAEVPLGRRDHRRGGEQAALRRATVSNRLPSVLCGSAFQEQGRPADARHAVIDYLPAPTDIPAVASPDARRRRVDHQDDASDDAPFSALVFKIMTDPFVGQLAYFRVYSGHMKPETAYSTASTADGSGAS
ncbi:MAG: GTP-binding protein [Thermoanaerobaculia bacterium]